MSPIIPLPLRPGYVLRSDPGVNRSTDLTILCADGRDCHATVQWWQTDARGLADAMEAAIEGLENADTDRAGALASWEADITDPFLDA